MLLAVRPEFLRTKQLPLKRVVVRTRETSLSCLKDPELTAVRSMHVYEVWPRKDKLGVDLLSDALPFGRLWYGGPNAVAKAIGYAKHRRRSHDAVKRVYDEGRRRKCRRKRLPSSMPNESKTPEEYVSDALDLMVKAKWIKQYGPSAKGFEVDWTDRGKLAMEALGYVIEDLGPENFNQQLWWAVGTLANMEFTSQS